MEKKLEVNFISISIPCLREKILFVSSSSSISQKNQSPAKGGGKYPAATLLLCSQSASNRIHIIIVESDRNEVYQTQLSHMHFFLVNILK